MRSHPALRRAALALGMVGSLAPGLVTSPAGPVWLAPGAGAVPAVPPAAGSSRLEMSALRRTWSWPLSPRPEVLAAYVPPRSSYGPGHRGIDLAAVQGQAVLAVDGGVVTHVGVIAGRGTVSVSHATGLRSTYEPVRGAVTTGEVVAEGQTLGSLRGRSHCGGACLHLGAVTESGYVDPRPLLGGSPVVLLPLGAGP